MMNNIMCTLSCDHHGEAIILYHCVSSLEGLVGTCMLYEGNIATTDLPHSASVAFTFKLV